MTRARCFAAGVMFSPVGQEWLTAQEVQARRGMPPIKITRVRSIQTRANAAWTIVKVETSEPGLYGIGSASDIFRPGTIPPAVEVLSQGLIGRDPDEIEDIWQANYMSSLWRNNATMNVALGGVDAALWDLKGKRANMPVYQLLGGRCRAAVPVYDHAREEKTFEAWRKLCDGPWRMDSRTFVSNSADMAEVDSSTRARASGRKVVRPDGSLTKISISIPTSRCSSIFGNRLGSSRSCFMTRRSIFRQ